MGELASTVTIVSVVGARAQLWFAIRPDRG
jgi:hypothetical protein